MLDGVTDLPCDVVLIINLLGVLNKAPDLFFQLKNQKTVLRRLHSFKQLLVGFRWEPVYGLTRESIGIGNNNVVSHGVRCNRAVRSLGTIVEDRDCIVGRQSLPLDVSETSPRF